jgi:lactoylglutathione lyase
MFSHVTVGITEFDRALAFYLPVMAVLGLRHRFSDPDVPRACWQPAEGGRPLFLITVPENGAPMAPGNGTMAAFLALNRETVRQVHAAALAHGGSDEGAPGLRPQYHADYYGAYFRDPDGNKLAVACHGPEGEAAPRPGRASSLRSRAGRAKTPARADERPLG